MTLPGFGLGTHPAPTVRAEWRHLWRFACVGVAGAATNTVALWLLTEHVGLHYLASSVVATEAAIVNNFTLNHAWTFESLRDADSLLARFGRYQAVSLGGFALMTGGLFAFTHLLGLHYLVANILASGCCGVWNYALSRFCVWRGNAADPAVEPAPDEVPHAA